MGGCYSKKSGVPGSESPEGCSIKSESSELDIREGNKISKESLDNGQMAFALARLEALESCLKEAEEKIKSLSEQLAASEGEKSKLLERVFWLEEKLEALNQKEDKRELDKKVVLGKDQVLQRHHDNPCYKNALPSHFKKTTHWKCPAAISCLWKELIEKLT
ncbi:coiled-coil domain-containing protein 192 [Manis javanica]|uniref:coiled-coil domain-containing protein 192 n=1 Tax=Manis javanica TaxID=9974 RepID=UPI003C6D7589|nr:Coiled-coil domain-containing protein 192 [Manis javanica]